MKQSLDQDFQDELDQMNSFLSKCGSGLAVEPAPTALGKSHQAQLNLYRHAISDVNDLGDHGSVLDLRKYIWMASNKDNLLSDLTGPNNKYLDLLNQLADVRSNKLGLKKSVSGVVRLRSKEDLFNDASLVTKQRRQNISVYVIYSSLVNQTSELFDYFFNLKDSDPDKALFERMKNSLVWFLDKVVAYQRPLASKSYHSDKLTNDQIMLKKDMNRAFSKFNRYFKEVCLISLKLIDKHRPELQLRISVDNGFGKSHKTWNTVKCTQYLSRHLGTSFVNHLYPQLKVPDAQIISLTVRKGYLPTSTVVSGGKLTLDWLRQCGGYGISCSPLLIIDELSKVKDVWNGLLFQAAEDQGFSISQHYETDYFDVISVVRLLKMQLSNHRLHATNYNFDPDWFDRLKQFYQNPLDTDSPYHQAIVAHDNDYLKQYRNLLAPLVEFFKFVTVTNTDFGFRVDNDDSVPVGSYQQMFVASGKMTVSSNILRQGKTLVYHPLTGEENVIKVFNRNDLRIVSLEDFDVNDPNQYLELSSVISHLQLLVVDLWHSLYSVASKTWADLDIDSRLRNLFVDLSLSLSKFLKSNAEVGGKFLFSVSSDETTSSNQLSSDFYLSGMNYFRTAMLDSDSRVYLEWIRVHTTPESMLLKLTKDFPVIALSADLEFPTSISHFNYFWIVNHLGDRFYKVQSVNHDLYHDIAGWIHLKNSSYRNYNAVAPRIDDVDWLLSSNDRYEQLSGSDFLKREIPRLLKSFCSSHRLTSKQYMVFLKEWLIDRDLSFNLTFNSLVSDLNQATQGHFVTNLKILISCLKFLDQVKATGYQQRSLLVLGNYGYGSTNSDCVKALNKLLDVYADFIDLDKINGTADFVETVASRDFHVQGIQTYSKNGPKKTIHWDQICDDLGFGKIKIILSTYQSMGTGPNPIYPIPDDLNDAVNVAPDELKLDGTDRRLINKDFDGLCLITPSNQLPSLGQADPFGDFSVSATCDAIFNTIELGQSLGVSDEDHAPLDRVSDAIESQAYLKINRRPVNNKLRLITPPKQFVNLFGTKVFNYSSPEISTNLGWHITQTVLQALGRVNRTFMKAAPVKLYLDGKFIDRYRAGLLHFEDLQSGKVSNLVSYSELNPIESVFSDAVAKESQRLSVNALSDQLKLMESMTDLEKQAVDQANRAEIKRSQVFKRAVRDHANSDQRVFDLRNIVADASIEFGSVLSEKDHDSFIDLVKDRLSLLFSDEELVDYQSLIDPYLKSDWLVNGYSYDLTKDGLLSSLSFNDRRQLIHSLNFDASDELVHRLLALNPQWRGLLPVVNDQQVGSYVLDPLFYRSLFVGELGENLIRHQIWPELVKLYSLPELVNYYTDEEFSRTGLDLCLYRETFDGWLKTNDDCKIFVDMKTYQTGKDLGDYLSSTVEPKVTDLQMHGIHVGGVLFLNLLAGDNFGNLKPQLERLSSGVKFVLVPTMLSEQLAGLSSDQYFGQLRNLLDQLKKG